jgi:D-methionine transport system substrate-binding protein
MKKLVAAVLTGVLVAGTLSTGVYAKDDDSCSICNTSRRDP